MEFPKIEVLPVVDRVVETGLWIGKLFTKHHYYEAPIEHFLTDAVAAEYAQFDLEGGRWDSEGNYHNGV